MSELTGTSSDDVVNYSYAPYGIVSVDGQTNNQYDYNGEYTDYLTGNQYLRARYYDPDTGSFTTGDSYSGDQYEPLSQNRYTYAGNDPVNTDDPSGYGWLKKQIKKEKKAAKSIKKKVCTTTKRIAKTVSAAAKKIDWKAVKKVAIGVAAVAVSVAAVALTGGAAATLVVAALNLTAGSLGAAVVSGAVVGAIGGASYSYTKSLLSGNDAETIVSDTVHGATSGAIIGGATGAIGYGISQVATKLSGLGNNGGGGGGNGTPAQGYSSKGYNPKSGERTIEGYVKQNANPEVSLQTESSGFNNNPKSGVGGEFKRVGAESHGGVSPHVHQPQRNVAPNGNIYGSVGSKTGNGGLTSPDRKDVKQLYEYLENGKYQ